MSKEVVVYVAEGQLNAEMVVAFLDANGIKSFASQEAVGSAFGIQSSFLGRAKVYVLEEDEDRARELLLAMDEGEMILPDDVDLTEEYEEGLEDDFEDEDEDA